MTRRAHRLIRFALALIVGGVTLGLGPNAVGATGAPTYAHLLSWLETPIDARSAGMGSADAGLADGPAGHYSNPAGLALLTDGRFSSSYRAMEFGRSLSYAGVTAPVRGEASLTFSWLYAGYGTVETRDNSGVTNGEVIGQNEHQFSVTFAKRFSRRVGMGFKVNYYHTKLDVLTSNSVTLDAGAMLFLDHFLYDRETIGAAKVRDFRVGVALRSIGSTFKMNTAKYWAGQSLEPRGVDVEQRAPISGVAGVSARFLNQKLLGAAEIEGHETYGMRLRAGAEYQIATALAIRLGMNRTALTAGAGFDFTAVGKNLGLDYAFQGDRVEEGSEHVISFRVEF